jgi:hypothetical protein
MEETLAKNSNIIFLKSKFFIYRLVIYFSFLLIPIWIQKSQDLEFAWKSLLMLFYMMFMASQWYLLGKEIDHRLKIYFRANSSIDRILYRLILGSVFIMILFNFVSLFPTSWIKHFFWGFWVVLGLFYSWPTRGKIIEESVSTQFTEYRFLDSFEKTVLFSTVILFLISFPTFTFYSNLESLKLVIDPNEKTSDFFWNFLSINYFPFKKYTVLMNLAWSMHGYFVNLIFYLFAFYGILRFFFSRRSSILGCFALLSTWSIGLILDKNPYSGLQTTFSCLWVWGILWTVKSSTYRSGLMFGLLCYLGVLINYSFAVLFPISLALLYLVFLRQKTTWYRNQFIRYNLLGIILSIIALLYQLDFSFAGNGLNIIQLKSYLVNLIARKAFFSLSIFGVIMLLALYFPKLVNKLTIFKLERDQLKDLIILFITILVTGYFFHRDLIKGFGFLWCIVFLSLIPLEWIFQTTSRFRSKRNVIYAIYVIICLLDSHAEVRARLAHKFFTQPNKKLNIESNILKSKR